MTGGTTGSLVGYSQNGIEEKHALGDLPLNTVGLV